MLIIYFFILNVLTNTLTKMRQMFLWKKICLTILLYVASGIENNCRLCLYNVSRKRPTFTTCYNCYIHSSIATIFGTNVADKVGNLSNYTSFSHLT